MYALVITSPTGNMKVEAMGTLEEGAVEEEDFVRGEGGPGSDLVPLTSREADPRSRRATAKRCRNKWTNSTTRNSSFMTTSKSGGYQTRP